VTGRRHFSPLRISPALTDGGYPRDGDDPRFSDHPGGVSTVVTSTATQDSGLFEVNLHDERYLPFEGAGVIGRWRAELLSALPRFDRESITDVVLHLRYTAREGGVPLRQAAQAHLRERGRAAAAAGTVRLISVRHEMPTAWARFTAATLSPQAPEARLTLQLTPEHYPFWARAVEPLALHRVELFAEPGPGSKPTVTVATAPDGDPARAEHALVTDATLGGMRVGRLTGELPPAVGELTWYLDDNTMRDLWVALTWGGQE